MDIKSKINFKMAIRYTSDLHLDHINIIKYCNRPFLKPDGSPDIWLMNKEIITRWNNIVHPNDITYVLGDFAMGKRSQIAPNRKRLNGKIILIKGNHDRSISAMLEAGFDEVFNELIINDDGFKVHMQHHPYKTAPNYPNHVWLHGMFTLFINIKII